MEAGQPGPPRPRVAVVGSLNADLVLPVARLPGAGETVLTAAPGRQILGGKGANQAAAAAAFGAAVTMAGRVGDDEVGRQILADLTGRGIDVTGVLVTAGARSGLAVIAVDAAGENLIIVDPGANQLLTAADVAALDLARADPPHAAVLLVQLEIPLEAVAAAMRAAGAARVVLNPAPAGGTPLPAEILALADVIVPNRTELAQLAGFGGAGGASGPAGGASGPAGGASGPAGGASGPAGGASGPTSGGGGPAAGSYGDPGGAGGAGTLAATAALARALPGDADVVVTLGREGALVVPRARGAPAVHIAAPEVQVADTTGAGDCFCGTLAVSLAEGLDLAEAARWSVAAAAVSTTAPGARGRLPARAEIGSLAGGLAVRRL